MQCCCCACKLPLLLYYLSCGCTRVGASLVLGDANVVVVLVSGATVVVLLVILVDVLVVGTNEVVLCSLRACDVRSRTCRSRRG